MASIATRYTRFIQKARYFVLAFWVLVDLAGLKYGLRFLDATSSQVTSGATHRRRAPPPPPSRSRLSRLLRVARRSATPPRPLARRETARERAGS